MVDKSSLIPSRYMLAMAKFAVSQSLNVKVSNWESKQEVWSRTRLMLDQYWPRRG